MDSIFYVFIGQHPRDNCIVIDEYTYFLGSLELIVSIRESGLAKLKFLEGSEDNYDVVVGGNSYSCMLKLDADYCYFVASLPFVEESVRRLLLQRVMYVFDKKFSDTKIQTRMGFTLKDLVLNFNRGDYTADFKIPWMIEDIVDETEYQDQQFFLCAFVAKNQDILAEYTDWMLPVNELTEVRAVAIDHLLSGSLTGYGWIHDIFGNKFIRTGYKQYNIACIVFSRTFVPKEEMERVINVFRGAPDNALEAFRNAITSISETMEVKCNDENRQSKKRRRSERESDGSEQDNLERESDGSEQDSLDDDGGFVYYYKFRKFSDDEDDYNDTSGSSDN